jgi:hypothetical protein
MRKVKQFYNRVRESLFLPLPAESFAEMTPKFGAPFFAEASKGILRSAGARSRMVRQAGFEPALYSF